MLNKQLLNKRPTEASQCHRVRSKQSFLCHLLPVLFSDRMWQVLGKNTTLRMARPASCVLQGEGTGLEADPLPACLTLACGPCHHWSSSLSTSVSSSLNWRINKPHLAYLPVSEQREKMGVRRAPRQCEWDEIPNGATASSSSTSSLVSREDGPQQPHSTDGETRSRGLAHPCSALETLVPLLL